MRNGREDKKRRRKGALERWQRYNYEDQLHRSSYVDQTEWNTVLKAKQAYVADQIKILEAKIK